MNRATLTVLNLNDHPIKIADHYTAVKLAVATERADQRNCPRRQAGEDRGSCSDCGWSGFVIVPHSDFCNAMEWRHTHHNAHGNPVYATCAVVCRCQAGKRYADQQQAESLNGTKKPMRMTLDEYEDRVNGNWRDQVRWLESKKKELATAELAVPVGTKDFIERIAKLFAGGKR